jgi:5-methylcytosine-specific restriction endonuclease McrA
LLVIEREWSEKTLWQKKIGICVNNWEDFREINCILLDVIDNDSYVLCYGNTDFIDFDKDESLRYYTKRLKSHYIHTSRFYTQEYIDSYAKEHKERNIVIDGMKKREKSLIYNKMLDRGEFLSQILGVSFYDLTLTYNCEICGTIRPKADLEFIKNKYFININNLKTYGVKGKMVKLEKELNKKLKNHKCCPKCYRNKIKEYEDFAKQEHEKITGIKFNKINNEREYIPAKLRIELLNESARYVPEEGKMIPSCSFCGATAREKTLHIDHIIPVSKGGETVKENLQVLCETCNLQKNNKYELIINKNVVNQ